MDKVYKLGLDIGSTTIKVVLLDGEKIIHSDYQRHHSDVSGLLNDLFEDLNKKFPGIDVDVVITGSGGLSVANWLGFKFTQEVMAETKAIKTYHPETDVIIELGGEDAKITYMHPVLEQRMNGTCAGGTGSFIDQMASLLQTDADGLNNFAKDYRSLYTIASRCGVFAKSDLQPLINDAEDLSKVMLHSLAVLCSLTQSLEMLSREHWRARLILSGCLRKLRSTLLWVQLCLLTVRILSRCLIFS